jgi:hypothetical protein
MCPRSEKDEMLYNISSCYLNIVAVFVDVTLVIDSRLVIIWRFFKAVRNFE